MALAGFKIGLVAGHIMNAGGEGREVRIAFCQADHQGVVVFCHHSQVGNIPFPGSELFGALDDQQFFRQGAVGGGQCPGDAKDEILGSERGAIAPLGGGAQVEGELG